MSLSLVTTSQRQSSIVRALRAIMLPAQAAPGYLAARLSQDTDNPNALYYREDWKTTEDLDRRIRSPQFSRLLALMEEASEPPELQLKWVSDVKSLEYLEAVRLGHAGN